VRVVFAAPALALALAAVPQTCPAATAWAPIEWPVAEGGNGHFYEYVHPIRTPSISWTQARDEAAARSLGGVAGHLATVTSAGERQFLMDHFNDGNGVGWDAWVGGFQTAGNTDPSAGWTWITGEPWGYTAWRAGEPNDAFATVDEQYLGIVAAGVGPNNWTWNDNTLVGVPSAYFIEYALPEPTSAAMLGLAGAAALARRRRRALVTTQP
jgi:hypothetical protein